MIAFKMKRRFKKNIIRMIKKLELEGIRNLTVNFNLYCELKPDKYALLTCEVGGKTANAIANFSPSISH